MECWDDDGDNMTLSAAVDSSNFKIHSCLLILQGILLLGLTLFLTAGVYTFGLSVDDNNGGQSSYAFTVTVSDDNAGCQPNYNLSITNLADGECCSSGGQCASLNCNYTTWVCEADNTPNNNAGNNNTANNNTGTIIQLN